MASDTTEPKGLAGRWRAKIDVGVTISLLAISISGLSFYRTYIYTKHDLAVTVTDVSYATNQDGLYMTVAFSNGGNRDAALIKVEQALWGRRGGHDPAWIPLEDRIHADIPLTGIKLPTIVKAGGIEVIKLSAKLPPAEAEQAAVAEHGAAFVGIVVETMKSDGNLYLIENPVAKLVVDQQGRIRSASPAIHRRLDGFFDLTGAPPGDTEQSNKQTPFVWADEHAE